MRLYLTIFSLLSIILLPGCSSKQEQLIVAQTITNYNVDKNATLVDEKIQDESPFRVQTYKVRFKDSKNIHWMHKQDSMQVVLSDISNNAKIT